MTKLLTFEETAERLRRPVPTLRYWMQRGTAPESFKVGRRRMFTEEAVEAWIHEHMAESA